MPCLIELLISGRTCGATTHANHPRFLEPLKKPVQTNTTRHDLWARQHQTALKQAELAQSSRPRKGHDRRNRRGKDNSCAEPGNGAALRIGPKGKMSLQIGRQIDGLPSPYPVLSSRACKPSNSCSLHITRKLQPTRVPRWSPNSTHLQQVKDLSDRRWCVWCLG